MNKWENVFKRLAEKKDTIVWTKMEYNEKKLDTLLAQQNAR